MNIPETRIAVTLFNLRDFCQNETDFNKTLDRLVKIGYKAVQVSAIPLPAKVIRAGLDSHGLFCCAAHAGYAEIMEQTDALAEKMNILGCDYVALGSAPEAMRNSEGFKKLAGLFNEKAQVLKKSGVRLGYHNHCEEFERKPGEQILFRYLIDNASNDVYFELDVHWITRGGADPAAWITAMKGRVPVIHIKDFDLENREPHFCEIGEGNLNWPAIFDAAFRSGTRWFSIEQDRPHHDRDLFESMSISYNNLLEMGMR